MNRRILANIVGRGWSTFAYLLTVPFYIHYLGIEAFAAMSLYVTLVSLSNVLDLGLSSTVSRELARLGAGGPPSAGTPASLMGTLESVYAAAGLLIGLGGFVVAFAVSSSWHTSGSPLHGHLLMTCILIALCVVGQWPVSFYSGALSGQGRQVELNVTLVVASTAQALAGILALALTSSRLELFFASQVVLAFGRALALRALVWRRLPGRWSFDWRATRPIFGFAGQMGAVGILGIVLTQADKLIVGAQVGALNFAYYGLAATVASGLSYLSLPVYDVAVPVLTAESASTERLERTYWATCRNLAYSVLPIGATLVLLSKPALFAWTGRPTGHDDATLLSLLAAGAILNALFCGLALQVASGRARPIVVINVVATLVYIPLLLVMVRLFGTVGAASTWLALNASYVVICGPALLAQTMVGSSGRWLLRFVVVPGLAAAAAATAVRLLLPGAPTRAFGAVGLVGAATLAALATVYAMPGLKDPEGGRMRTAVLAGSGTSVPNLVKLHYVALT